MMMVMNEVADKPALATQEVVTQDLATQELATQELATQEKVVRTGFWRKLRRVAGHVPFAEDAVAAYFCALDPATPFRVRATLFGALAYFLLPFDSLPDIFPLLGFVDDASVIAAALAAIGAHLEDRHRLAAKQALGGDVTDPAAS
jgi:uncharacterized membrane protein YkvA (DUF1232 family)